MLQTLGWSRAEAARAWSKVVDSGEGTPDDRVALADALIRRILFLEGTPDLSLHGGLRIGKTVPEMLRNDLDLEYEVVKDLRDAMSVCETEQDYQSREILEAMLADTEEDHAYWLEKQLSLIEKMGLANYLQSQTGN